MRRVAVLLVLVSLGLLAWLWPAFPPASSQAFAPVPFQPTRSVPLRLPNPRPGQELVAKLAVIVDYAGLDDPKATLIDELDRLARVYRVTFDVNERVFKRAKVADVLKQEIANPNAIPPMKTTLGVVLQKILGRLSVPSGYLVRRDVIEITTQAAMCAEVCGKDWKGPLPPLVHLTAYKLPLDEALALLANQASMSITLDPRVGHKTQTQITVHLINSPVDAAVFLLTDMAELSFVRIDNAFYVTSPERVRVLQKAWNSRRSAPASGKEQAKTAKQKSQAGKPSATKK